MTIFKRATTAVRAWYARRSDEFRAGWVSAWVSFTAATIVPVFGLIDKVQDWIAGNGDLELGDLVSVGRVVASGLLGLVSWAINYGYRRWRPNVRYVEPGL